MRPRRSRSASEDLVRSVARPRTARLPCRRASGGAPRLRERGVTPVESAAGWRAPRGPACVPTSHWAAARGATRQSTSLRWRAGRSVVSCGLGFDGAGPAACSRPGAPLTVGGAAHAVLAPRDDAGGPHVRQTPTHPRVSEPRTGVDLSGGRGLGRHGGVARVPRQEAVVAEGPPNAVRRSISTGLRPPAPRLPGHPPAWCQPGASTRGTRAVVCRASRHVARKRPDRGRAGTRTSGRAGRPRASAVSPRPARGHARAEGRAERGSRLEPPPIPMRPPRRRGVHASAGRPLRRSESGGCRGSSGGGGPAP